MYKIRHLKSVGKVAVAVSVFTMLSACELLKKPAANNKEDLVSGYALCESALQLEEYSQFCEIESWISYMFEVQLLTWPQRVEMIAALTDDKPSMIKKVLLSQGVDTPYNQRLRAQNWIVKLDSGASPTMSTLLNKTIFANSQQLLEFESAITILSRVNSRQEKEITALQMQLENREAEIIKQQQQVEQLLKIESDLSKQNRNQNNTIKSPLDGQNINEANRSN